MFRRPALSRLVTAAGVVLAALLTVLATSGMARAHGGPIALEVQGDGGQGVTAAVSYARDHHPVEVEVDLSFTAVSAEGDTLGPVPMVASNEGRGFYVSTKKLPVGKWTVTMSATHPSAATKTVAVESAVLPPANRPAPAPSGMPAAAVVAGAAAIVAVLAAAAFFGSVALRRRRTA
ncbi:MAG TPA: hypothetical protein VH969_00015 [Actinophytocola sp.]|jgi:hypothetical protein|uniref:hypothetical protein n=1 Tax=Actinophytocola sp. TaxID=1872138 RepID=UPI002F925AA9